MSLSHKGKPAWNKGKKMSPQQREKLLTTHRTPEYRKKMSEARMGKNNPMYGRRGEKSPFWKGESVSYAGLHKWVAKELGRPTICSSCGNKKKYIDWANKSREYKRNLNDWIALCRSCHRKYDGFIFNKKVKKILC